MLLSYAAYCGAATAVNAAAADLAVNRSRTSDGVNLEPLPGRIKFVDLAGSTRSHGTENDCSVFPTLVGCE